jgi:hypothetical protein
MSIEEIKINKKLLEEISKRKKLKANINFKSFDNK